MAVTSIWPIKGRLDKVVNYARNPEKTIEKGLPDLAAMHMVDDVLEYAADDVKTERRSFVTCLNCQEETAARQFTETKLLWSELSGRDKTSGRACYHGYQSFKAEEVTAEIAHEIGVKLAQELWGDRFEVLVATHCNTGHYHNHFVINSVSFQDGIKFHNTHEDYAKMREVSDRLCREYGLSVVKQPEGKSKSYGEWQAEKEGRPTHRGSIRADIDRAIAASTTERDFIRVMTEMGYEFKTRAKDGQPLKYPALKPPGAKGYFRFHKLGAGYSLEEVKSRILRNIRKEVPFPETEHRPRRCYRLKGKPRKKLTGLQALYFRYCYELHIIVKRPASVSSPQSPLYSVSAFGENCVRSLASPLPTKSSTLRGPRKVSFLLREDVAKLERLDRETLFLAREGIVTMGQLSDRRGAAEGEIESLTAQRQELRKELRRLIRKGDQQAADEIRGQIGQLSGRLKKLRKEVVLCDGIALRSGQVKENLEQLLTQQNIERKEKNRDELPRRRGGAGRPFEPGDR